MPQETPAEKLERKQSENTGRAPKAGKRPMDHKKPKPKPDTEGYVPVEFHGAVIRVEANLDPAEDFELMDALGAIELGTTYGLGEFLRRIVHTADYRALLDAVRGENGKVAIEDLAVFIPEALEAAGVGNS